MGKYKINEEVINMVMWIYQNTKLKVGNEEVDIGSGVIQGGVLSPTLFNITFNELLEELRLKGLDIGAYADDLVITGNGIVDLKKAI